MKVPAASSLGRYRPVAATAEFSTGQPAMLARQARFGQKQMLNECAETARKIKFFLSTDLWQHPAFRLELLTTFGDQERVESQTATVARLRIRNRLEFKGIEAKYSPRFFSISSMRF
jgi:hypothetical protein